MRKSLDKLSIGDKAIVVSIGSSGAVRRHIIDMGITPGAEVVMKKAAPLGDPLEINVRGYELSMRKSEAKEIIVEDQKI
ncbi:MAG: FeoA family protein [Oscillospiraceae bacterium]